MTEPPSVSMRLHTDASCNAMKPENETHSRVLTSANSITFAAGSLKCQTYVPGIRCAQIYRASRKCDSENQGGLEARSGHLWMQWVTEHIE